MAGSAEERAIRDAVADHARKRLANARIIHELVVGGCRADVAAVTRDRVILFEIKSCKDVLDRLQTQQRHFCRAAHETILVADVKWFTKQKHFDGGEFLVPGSLTERECGCSLRWSAVWCWPQQDRTLDRYGAYAWEFPKQTLQQPDANALLELLWKEELQREAAAHGVACGSRETCRSLIDQMVWHMTGREIAEAVCRQLRSRPFPEADAPICGDEVRQSVAAGDPVQARLGA